VALAWFLLALQPVLIHTTTEEVPGYVLVAVDRSPAWSSLTPRLTRTEVARRVLTGPEVSLLARLRGKHHVHVIAFDKDAWDVGLDDVDALLRPASGVKGDAVTNLRVPLARALERSGTQPRRSLGVVLLTERPAHLGRAAGRPGACPRRPWRAGVCQSPSAHASRRRTWH